VWSLSKRLKNHYRKSHLDTDLGNLHLFTQWSCYWPGRASLWRCESQQCIFRAILWACCGQHLIVNKEIIGDNCGFCKMDISVFSDSRQWRIDRFSLLSNQTDFELASKTYRSRLTGPWMSPFCWALSSWRPQVLALYMPGMLYFTNATHIPSL